MITVFLDSSNTSLSVGLSKDNILIGKTSYECWQEQSEFMIPELEKLFKENKVNREDISDVVVAIGPGSYTGVRIAITIAKVMSAVLNIPLYPVSSLQILKCEKKPSICVINARSNRSYVGVYSHDKCLLKDQIMTNDELREYISSHPDYVLCGDTAYLGIEGYKSDILDEMNSLKDSLIKCPNSYGLKPVYLKD